MKVLSNVKSEERINILMVDDSATNLLALESILRGPDRHLIRASSGEDALRYLLDHEAAVILLDVYMPGIDGLQTAELIRGREKSRDRKSPSLSSCSKKPARWNTRQSC